MAARSKSACEEFSAIDCDLPVTVLAQRDEYLHGRKTGENGARGCQSSDEYAPCTPDSVWKFPNNYLVTANITGYSVYHGLVTSLDTLCAQAYGSGRRHLVGLQLQRMICFLIVITVPIAVIWFNGTAILKAIVPEQETAELAGLYLKIIILGAPGYACFEAGKRYMQAQGLFDPVLYVLVFLAPFNVFLNWLFVWVCFSLLLSSQEMTNTSHSISAGAL